MKSAAVAVLVCALLLIMPMVSTAAVQVEIEGVTGDLLKNVEAYLDIKRRAGEEGLTETKLRLMFSKAEEEIRRALRPFGYYDPQVQSSLKQIEGGWVARFEIDPGVPVHISKVDIQIEGEGHNDPAFDALIEASELSPGKVLRHDRYDRLKSQLVETASNRGYFDARFLEARLLVDPQRKEAWVELRFDTGPRYRIGSVRIEQDFLLEKIVQRAILFKKGEYFDAEKLRKSEFALYEMGNVSLVDMETLPDAQTREVAVTVRLTPPRKNRWTVGGGYSTDTNIYIRAGWERLLVNRRGDRIGFNVRYSEPLQDMLFRYVIPTGKPSEHLTIYTGFIRDQRGDTLSNRFEIAPVDTRFWGPWQREVFGILQAEQSDIAQISFNDFFLIPGIRIIRSEWNSLVRPTKGWKGAFELRGSTTGLGAATDYAQLLARTATYIPIAARSRFYLRGQVGLSAVDDFAVLPASQRFFAGGDRSVRGWGLNQLSPVNAEGDLIGGKYLVFASVELEYDILKSWTLDTFFDTGNAFDEFGDPLEYSAGAGFRWHSPVGLIGLDLAQPLSEPDMGLRVHFSVRPEL